MNVTFTPLLDYSFTEQYKTKITARSEEPHCRRVVRAADSNPKRVQQCLVTCTLCRLESCKSYYSRCRVFLYRSAVSRCAKKRLNFHVNQRFISVCTQIRQ
jgi:hypothetical protein